MSPVMLKIRIFALCLFLLACLAFAFPTARALAASAAGPVKEESFKKNNRAATEKLKSMSRAQIMELDRRLARALKLFYDKEYQKALPLLQALAAEVETMDLMFWIGQAAFHLKRYPMAERQYHKMLAIDPDLNRVRLELALVYLHTGRIGLAQNELLRVKKTKPPKNVLANIQRLLGRIEKQNKTFEYTGRLSMGLMWDSNASFGPELKPYEVPGGTLTPSAASSEAGDWAALTSLQVNFTYRPRPENTKGLLWAGAASLFNQVYRDQSPYNYQMADVFAGPLWVGDDFLARLPLGYTYRYYGNDPLSQTYRAEPSLHWFFGSRFSLRGEYSLSLEEYNEESRHLLDNQNHRFELSPSLHFFKRAHTISLLFGWENHLAESQRYTYLGPYVGVAYFASLPGGREVYLKYQWSRRDYQGIEPFFAVGRLDRRHTILAVASQRFWKRFYLSLTLCLVENGSNVDIYDVDRFTASLSLGVAF